MQHQLEIEQWIKVAHLFESHILTKSVINPCIHSGIGSLTVDNVNSPTVAKYSIPMMIFLAGDTTNPAALELIKSLPPLTIFIVPNKSWSRLLKEVWGNRLVTNKRNHLDHSTLEISYLRRLKDGLPKGYSLMKLDIDVASLIEQEYATQIQMYFGTIENLVKVGFGFCILNDEERLVSYAYTPFPFTDEFEIQVYTKDSRKYRRKGLATVVSAALIEHGLENNLVPHWDAANEASVNLALKLGYTNPVSWSAYYYTKEYD